MKIPVIKKIVEAYSLEELQKAEAALYEEQTMDIELGGDDVGEQLTHILAAIFIKEEMAEKGSDLKTALRAYTLKVRNSIS
ncbi:hypothetical protein OAD66_00675 [Bacteroidia bacterium]|nr:hypothetical protein [Bacteroidia bacterium]MDB4107467.1 hypothetical protein [Bacteroidia bacterium]MDB9881640.1 hypothetical protein [Bacteroidia bacterium]